MPRAPSENSIKAEKLYREGKKLTEIAKILGVPDGTVRRWKHDHAWENKTGKPVKKKDERSSKKARKKEPAPNARKAGAPKGNKNALKHGGYSKVYWDTLDEDELELAMDMTQDEELLLIDQIRLFAVRERRIMKAINWYRNQEERLSVASVSRQEEKRSFKTEADKELYDEIINEKVESGARLPGNRYNVVTNTEPKDSAIARLEKELSVVQGKKTIAIQALADLRLEKAKMNTDADKDDLVQAWIAGLMGGE